MKNNLQTAIQAFSTKSLLEASIAFFSTLGYNTSLQNPLEIPTLQGFFDAYQGIETNINITPDLTKQIKEVQLLFQITQAQITSQIDVFDVRKVDNKIIESYLFLGIELAGKSYSRTQMSTIVRAINKGFPMPVIIVFKHHNCLTLSIIDRRINKKDENRDVLEKITFIKDINIQQPNRGHIEILEDLSFTELHRIHRFDNFVALHEAWRKTLDINVLNKKFYRELFTWYLWAVKNVKFPKPDNEPLSDEAHQSISVIRLLTRLIFVWFVKEKHLIKDDLFEENILKNYLKDFNPDSSETSDYYKAILQNLFFATLNSPMDRDAQTPEEKRGFIDRTSTKPKGYSDNYLDHTKYRYANLFQDKNKALSLFEDIPFLNGGLFECLDSEVGDDAKNRTERRYDGFSDTAKKQAIVPNCLFFGESKQDLSKELDDKKQKDVSVKGIIDILKSYKFTITENTPFEEEVALDPELLGKVFENLLASYNPETQSTARKQTGSFYTPREIVNYMVDESLKAYLRPLAPRGGISDYDIIEDLFSHSEEPFTPPLGVGGLLIQALSDCKILDPACGSGAFPMGVLQRMVQLLAKLDPNNKQWKTTLLNRAEQDLNTAENLQDEKIREIATDAANARMTYIRDSFASKNHELDYTRKLFLIENCIYGVDIQQIAVQISKLRFFISLIVEQQIDPSQKNLGILSMPNLETKFVAANTLIGLDKPKEGLSFGLFNSLPDVLAKEKELDEVRKKIFFVKRYADKKKLKTTEAKKRQELKALLMKNHYAEGTARQMAEWNPFDVTHSAPFFDMEMMFGEDLKTGFDIVIGNPPYVSISKLSDKDLLKKQNFETFESSGDLYALFYEKGNDLINTKGHLCFITSNKWLRAGYGQSIRKYFTEKTNPITLIDFVLYPMKNQN